MVASCKKEHVVGQDTGLSGTGIYNILLGQKTGFSSSLGSRLKQISPHGKPKDKVKSHNQNLV